MEDMPTWYKAFLHFNIPLYSIFEYSGTYKDYYISGIPIGVDHPTYITMTNNGTKTILNVKTHTGVNNARGYRNDIQYEMKSNDPNNPDFLVSKDNTLYYNKEWDRWIIESIHVASPISVEDALPYFLKHNNLK